MSASPREGKDGKSDRLELRASPRQTAVIRQAAEATEKTVSSFVLDAAYMDAQRILADRRLFSLDADRWQRFAEILDRPAVDKPRLRELMKKPGVLD